VEKPQPREPGYAQCDAQNGQQHAEQEEGFATRKHIIHHSKFMPKKPVKAVTAGRSWTPGSPVDLFALALGDRCREFMRDVGHPPPTLVELLFDVLHLFDIVVQFIGARSRRLAGPRRQPSQMNRAAVATEGRRESLHLLEMSGCEAKSADGPSLSRPSLSSSIRASRTRTAASRRSSRSCSRIAVVGKNAIEAVHALSELSADAI